MGDRTQSFAFQQAQMLYDIARSEQQIAAITQEVLAFKEGMNGANALFVNVMSRQAIAADEKNALLVDLMTPFSAAFQQFMEPFMKHKRHADIAESILWYERLYREHCLLIESAVPLTEQQAETIFTLFRKKVNKRLDAYLAIVTPEIIGGVRVSVKGYQLDRTIAAALQEAEQALLFDSVLSS